MIEISWWGAYIAMGLSIYGMLFGASMDSLFVIIMFGFYAILASLALLYKTIQDANCVEVSD